MKRRDFLKIGTAGASAALLAGSPVYASSKAQKVIVIGAGLSGLMAAYRLMQNKVEVVLLEAQNRIGGRIFTHTIDEESGLNIELGAEWVGASHEKLINLCKELGLKLLNHQFDTHLSINGKYYPANEWGYEKEWEKKYLALLKSYTGYSEKQLRQLDKSDWWRYLKKTGISDKDLEIFELANSTDFGESIRMVSAYSAFAEYAESSPKNEMDFKVEGGNGKITEALTSRIGEDKIRKNQQVAAIDQSGKTVKVRCNDGTMWEAEKVICTLPVHALLQIEFKPALPALQLEALEALQYARIVKTSILFKERFWKLENFDMLTDSLGHYYFHTTKNQPGVKGVLTSYAIGDKAYLVSKLSNPQKIKEICKGLEPAFGNVEPLAEKIVGYYWGNDRFTQGGYALYGKNQNFELKKEIAKPFKNVLFAGEHLAEWQGFMEGALDTGEQAAKNLS